MPNRYVREGIIESKRVNSLSWLAEVFYRRLINRVDDFGRYTADPDLLRASLFPLQLHKVQAADIGKLLLECENAGLGSTWKGEDGKEYLVLHKWEKGRALKSKYPNPPTHVYKREHMFADVPDPGTDSDPGTDPDSDRARGFPNEKDAVSVSDFVGVPKDFAAKAWHKANSRGGCDARDVPIRNWRSYLRTEWCYEQERKEKEKTHGSNREAGRKDPNAGIVGHQPGGKATRVLTDRKAREAAASGQ